MEQLTLKNRDLFGAPARGVHSLQSWLLHLSLGARESRIRTRFVRLLEPRMKEIDAEVEKIRMKYATKDEKGDAVGFDKDGKETSEKRSIVQYKFGKTPEESARIKEELDKEVGDYFDEKLVIDVTPATRECVDLTKKLLLETEEKFAGQNAENYDSWCEAFEAISPEKPAEQPEQPKK